MLLIRGACSSDVLFLYELYMKHITQSPPKEPHNIAKWSALLKKLIENSDYHLLVGEIGSRVISSVTIVVISNLTHNLRPYSLIENVVTHSDHRNKGYASALMSRASEIASENDCYKIMLMTGAKSENTLRFYEQCGFNRNDKTAFIKWL